MIALAALLCLAARNLFRTRVGRAFIALRERDYAAEVLGINVVRYKLLAFALGAAYAGVAGALTGTFLRIVNPDQFTLARLGVLPRGRRGRRAGHRSSARSWAPPS